MKSLAKAIVASTRLTDAAKTIAMAQALLESGRGTSRLYIDHRNPFGMKYRPRIAAHATPVQYVASDGEDTYALFATLEDTVDGYATFIETGPYKKPADNSVETYLDTLVEGGYAVDPAYRAKVLSLIEEANNLLAEAADTTTDTVVPITPRRSARLRVGIVVGHNSHGQGAYATSPIDESEYPFNTAVAELMAEYASEYEIETAIFYRRYAGSYSKEIDTVYAETDAWGAEVTIELHFNSVGNSSVRGSEVLASRSTASQSLAEFAQDELVGLFGRTGNADRGVKVRQPGGERGWRSLYAGRAPAILVEPFFGSNKDDRNLMAQIGKPALAEAYLSALASYAGQNRSALDLVA
ncbi:N-acetylmuramoyl-L-alanine amidase [Roseibium sp. HPY-6]|uniref:N-acetylmuramoyl-L-alanine amidase n=1 Tax=Roseibium sp. HPY-6 TaxID=3229852 RepID=UPI0033905BE4